MTATWGRRDVARLRNEPAHRRYVANSSREFLDEVRD